MLASLAEDGTMDNPKNEQQSTTPLQDLPDDFETLLQQLDETVRTLESGQLGLEASLASFERGMMLSRKAADLLDAAEARVDELTRREDGSTSTRPLAST
jgi:exodeoxyribonuclease VII small subunit